MIETNNIGHQVIVDVHRDGPAYSLPHLLNRDAGGRPIRDVLIMAPGRATTSQPRSGTGPRRSMPSRSTPASTDSAANRPPEPPLLRPARARSTWTTAAASSRRATGTYDLVTYALVDSLVLHSGYSSLRLESFLFTEEAFRDIKAKLKPGGAFVMYNAYRQGWVVGRLAIMAEKVFGTKPIVLSLPHVDTITAEDAQEAG